jgi:hypothetical protein
MGLCVLRIDPWPLLRVRGGMSRLGLLISFISRRPRESENEKGYELYDMIIGILKQPLCLFVSVLCLLNRHDCRWL